MTHRLDIIDRLSIGRDGQSLMLDGHDVSDVIKGYTITGSVRQRPEITLDLARIIDVSTLSEPGRISIDPSTADLLVRLGWTPPDGYEAGDVLIDPDAAHDVDLRTLGDPVDDAAAYHRGKAEALEETYEYVGKHGTSDLLEWLRRRANAFRGPR